MPRPYVFPDPSKRSQWEPSDYCSNEKVVGLYNQEHGTDRKNFSEQIGDWFVCKAKEIGWKQVEKASGGFTLVAEIQIPQQVQNNGMNSNVVPIRKAAH